MAYNLLFGGDFIGTPGAPYRRRCNLTNDEMADVLQQYMRSFCAVKRYRNPKVYRLALDKEQTVLDKLTSIIRLATNPWNPDDQRKISQLRAIIARIRQDMAVIPERDYGSFRLANE